LPVSVMQRAEKNVNIRVGTITCNDEGTGKDTTVIGDNRDARKK
jgi:bifunctional N-acetylglucosamine-1-phosphate-uridyltransferase/glucosamine-1-phosphate-acetyltransferase GlmU-like protein